MYKAVIYKLMLVCDDALKKNNRMRPCHPERWVCCVGGLGWPLALTRYNVLVVDLKAKVQHKIDKVKSSNLIG